MKKKTLGVSFAIITTLSMFTLLLAWFLHINGVGIFGRCSVYVSDYDEFYIIKKDSELRPLLFGGPASSGYKVWFLPGQKDKMLSKIKQDVKDELADMISNNSDLFKGYEISDDFRKVYVYYYKDMRNRDINYQSAIRIDKLADKMHSKTVALKVELYHNVIYGYANSVFDGNIVNMVEVEGT